MLRCFNFRSISSQKAFLSSPHTKQITFVGIGRPVMQRLHSYKTGLIFVAYAEPSRTGHTHSTAVYSLNLGSRDWSKCRTAAPSQSPAAKECFMHSVFDITVAEHFHHEVVFFITCCGVSLRIQASTVGPIIGPCFLAVLGNPKQSPYR